jgi:hypothetical protein
MITSGRKHRKAHHIESLARQRPRPLAGANGRSSRAGRTFFGQVQPGEALTQLRDGDNRRRYATITLVLATELDGGVKESIFPLPKTTSQEWIYTQEKAFPLPF